MMTPDVIEKKWRCHDDLAVTVNDAAPWPDPAVSGTIAATEPLELEEDQTKTILGLITCTGYETGLRLVLFVFFLWKWFDLKLLFTKSNREKMAVH